jgi:VanZ family protein
VTRWLRAWGPALVCAALIFYASSRSTVPVSLGGGKDKLAHFAAYSVFGLALGYARARTGLPFAVAALVGFLYALSDELHQSFVPGRAAEFGDWVADALGVLAGLAAFHLWRRRRSASRGRESAAETPLHP